MKKLIAMLLAVSMVLAFAACGKEKAPETTAPVTEAPTTEAPTTEAPTTEATQAPETEPAAPAVMSHEEYVAAELQTPVCVETYVQATQSWWDNKITVYAQSEDGAYFVYEMACAEEDAAKLVPGTKLRVSGFKGEWSGEVEIVDATFEIIEGSFIAEATDVTELLGTEELIDHQNEKVSFKGLTVAAVKYKNDEPGDDIYLTLTYGEGTYEFCVERYLTGPETEVYAAVGELKAGDVIDVEGFLYWYEGVNTHVTSVTVASAAPAVMSHEEYVAAELQTPVCVETYVQATQSWWDNKITVYAQSEDGAYFVYEMACAEEDAAKLVPGTKLRVNGYKGEWAGEVEIVDATFEIIEGSFIAEATDVTELLGTEELIDHQNEKVSFKGLTVAAVKYKNDEPGDDIYLTLTYGEGTYEFCVERYLTGPETEVYAAVGELVAGDVIDLEGFLYWYEGVNTHVTSVSKA